MFLGPRVRPVAETGDMVTDACHHRLTAYVVRKTVYPKGGAIRTTVTVDTGREVSNIALATSQKKTFTDLMCGRALVTTTGSGRVHLETLLTNDHTNGNDPTRRSVIDTDTGVCHANVLETTITNTTPTNHDTKRRAVTAAIASRRLIAI